MSKWVKGDSINVDNLLKGIEVSDKDVYTWENTNEGPLYRVYLGEHGLFGRLYFTKEYKVVKLTIFMKEGNEINWRITNPQGEIITTLMEHIKTLPIAHEAPYKAPTGPQREITCHFCGAKESVRVYEDPNEEDWLNFGQGVYYIGWTPWVKCKEDEVVVCPSCRDNIEMNIDGAYEVME